MICSSIEAARKQAQANANNSNRTWIVFIDTSGNPNCEQLQIGSDYQFEYEVFNPTEYPPPGWQPDQNRIF